MHYIGHVDILSCSNSTLDICLCIISFPLIRPVFHIAFSKPRCARFSSPQNLCTRKFPFTHRIFRPQNTTTVKSENAQCRHMLSHQHRPFSRISTIDLAGRRFRLSVRQSFSGNCHPTKYPSTTLQSDRFQICSRQFGITHSRINSDHKSHSTRGVFLKSSPKCLDFLIYIYLKKTHTHYYHIDGHNSKSRLSSALSYGQMPFTFN